MNLTLKSFQRVKSDAMSLITNFDTLEAANENIALREEIRSISSIVDNVINNIMTVEQYRASLEKCGYSDRWFDAVNATESFKKLVDIDIPRFTSEHFKRGEICTESMWESIKRWISTAWEMVKKFFAWCADQLHKLVVFLGIDQGNLSRFEEEALRWADQYFDNKLNARGIKCNEMIDLSVFKDHIRNIIILEAIIFGGSMDKFSMDFIKEDVGNIVEDRAHRADVQTAVAEMFARKLKRHLDEARVGYTDINKNGIAFEGNTLQIYNGTYPKSNITITSKEDVQNAFKTCIDLRNEDGTGAFETMKLLAKHIENTLRPHRDALAKVVGAISTPRPNDMNSPDYGFEYVNPLVNVCQYNIILTITSKIIAFCAKYKNTVMSNAKTLANLIKMANNQKPEP